MMDRRDSRQLQEDTVRREGCLKEYSVARLWISWNEKCDFEHSCHGQYSRCQPMSRSTSQCDMSWKERCDLVIMTVGSSQV